MTSTFTLTVETTGDHTEEELREYLYLLLGFGMVPQRNPFANEDSETEINQIEIE